MIDGQGRTIDYLRVSLTDRCNLSCRYCMPGEGIRQIQPEDILTLEEIRYICTMLAKEGIRKIKLTGGEPLVRKNCVQLVKSLKQIPGIEKVTLTTNGVLLKDQMRGLAEAGLDGVNISLDTLDEEQYEVITGKRMLSQVLDGIQEALKYSEVVVKINCVPVLEEKENLIRMAELARKWPLHVRFIEMMPLGQGRNFHAWQGDQVLSVLTEVYGSADPCREKPGNGPAHYYSFEGFMGKVGFISAVTHKFCSQCNRIRLTADGCLKTCLQYSSGKDLKGCIRSGCSEEEFLSLVQEALRQKPEGHHFLEPGIAEEETRFMAQIGG